MLLCQKGLALQDLPGTGRASVFEGAASTPRAEDRRVER